MADAVKIFWNTALGTCVHCAFILLCALFAVFPSEFCAEGCVHLLQCRNDGGRQQAALCSPHAQGTCLLLTVNVVLLWTHRAPALHVWLLITVVSVALLLCGPQVAGLNMSRIN